MGAEPQWSTTLLAPTIGTGAIGNLLVCVTDQLRAGLSCANLSRRVAMSLKNSSRHSL